MPEAAEARNSPRGDSGSVGQKNSHASGGSIFEEKQEAAFATLTVRGSLAGDRRQTGRRRQ